jgi:predicted phage terminase large subunit-like protein
MSRPIIVKCPLCKDKVIKGHLQGSGICVRCHEGKARAISDALAEAFVASSNMEEEALSIFLNLERRKQAVIKRKEDAEYKHALAVEENRLLAIHREQASVALARRSLLHYVERRIKNYQTGWLHEDIARRIEKFVEGVERGESPRLILSIGPRLGKALKNKEKILTANRGWITHGELKVGDLVFGSNGKPTEVVAVGQEIYDLDHEIEFQGGQKLTAHAEHEWFIRRISRNREWDIVETKHLVTSARTGKPLLQVFGPPGKRGSQFAFAVPCTPSLIYQESILPMDPYVMGAILGDGCSVDARITHHKDEKEIIREIERKGYVRTSTSYYTAAGSSNTRFGNTGGRHSSRMLREMKSSGIYGNKHIPRVYFASSERQRLELLAGLIDTDGTVCKSTSRVSISTCSDQLRDDYVELIRSLGQRPYVCTTQPCLSTSGIQGKKPTHNVVFQSTRDDIPTVLPRKRIWRTVALPPLGITAIRKVPAQPGKCIQVAAADGMYLVGEGLIPTHNSELASDSGPAWILGHHPDWEVILASYSDELPTKFSRSIREQVRSAEYKEIFPRGPVIKADDAGAGAWRTEQGGGFRAVGVGGAITGFGANVLILDDCIRGEAEARSPVALEKLWQWATSTASSRLMPLSGVIIIAQRWAVMDLIGRFEQRMAEEMAEVISTRKRADDYEEEGDIDEAERHRLEAKELDESMDKWHLVKYSALAVEDEYLTPEGEITRVSAQQTPLPSWRLLRRKGESIHPQRFPRGYYLNKKRLNPTLFSAMYQQEPVSLEDSYFSGGDFRRYEKGKHPKLENCNVFASWDLAVSTATYADFTVGICAAMDCKGDVYILDRIKGRFGDIYEISDLIIDLHVKWKCQQTGIERMMLSMALGPVLKRRMQERKQYINLAEGKEELRAGNQDKKVRARQIQALLKQGKILVPEGESWDEFIAILSSFGFSGHDDDADSMAYLGIMFNRTPPPRDPSSLAERVGKKFRSWIDEMNDEIGLMGHGSDDYMSA